MSIISIEKSNKAHNILQNYNGVNPYILELKKGVFTQKLLKLTDFHINYILQNHNFQPKIINKIAKIAQWYGEKKKEDWNLEFVPEKLLISTYIGETDNFYHVFVKYRRSQTQLVPIFLPKKAILTNVFIPNFEDKVIDFSKYNSDTFVLKPQQEQGVKFLTTMKKAILAHQMGGGKTATSIVAAIEDGFEKILVICPASVKSNWFAEINRFVPQDDITIVEGSKWKESRFTIINYDILDNFYEIPTEIVKRKTKTIDDNGKITYKYIEKEVVSKKSAVVNEAMEHSQLFTSKFDLIIIDEAHRLSNANSGRYKIISDLIKRSNPIGIYELTGTMITNNPMNLYNILKIIDADITKDWAYYVKTYCDGKQIYVKAERDKLTNAFLRKKHKNSWYDLSFQEKNELNNHLDKYCRKIWLTNGSSNLDELKEKIKHLYLRDLNEDIYNNFSKKTEVISYNFSQLEQTKYDSVWEEYVASHGENKDDLTKLLDNKRLIESSVLRQATSDLMIPHTISLVESEISKGNKVIVFCAFDNEIYTLQEHFGNKCVIHNGKLTPKAKDAALEKFNSDPNCMVFLGNLTSSSVGLNLIAANRIVFNSVSWLPAENQQAEYRILRIGQSKDCVIYYQKFNNSYMDKMFDILNIKNQIIDSVIVDEKSK